MKIKFELESSSREASIIKDVKARVGFQTKFFQMLLSIVIGDCSKWSFNLILELLCYQVFVSVIVLSICIDVLFSCQCNFSLLLALACFCIVVRFVIWSLQHGRFLCWCLPFSGLGVFIIYYVFFSINVSWITNKVNKALRKYKYQFT